MNELDNPPAFPIPEAAYAYEGVQTGMTLRDYFAGQALAGLLTGQFSDTSRHNFDALPKEAFDIADAMLAARALARALKDSGHE